MFAKAALRSRRERSVSASAAGDSLWSAAGTGKPLEDYRLTARGGKGVINMKVTPRIGKVVAILSVKEDTDLMIITKDGKIIRIESGEIRQAGRGKQYDCLLGISGGVSVKGGRIESIGSEPVQILGANEKGELLVQSLEPGKVTLVAPPPYAPFGLPTRPPSPPCWPCAC